MNPLPTSAQVLKEWKMLVGIASGAVVIITLFNMTCTPLWARTRTAVTGELAAQVARQNVRIDVEIAERKRADSFAEHQSQITQMEFAILAHAMKADKPENRDALLNNVDTFKAYAESLNVWSHPDDR